MENSGGHNNMMGMGDNVSGGGYGHMNLPMPSLLNHGQPIAMNNNTLGGNMNNINNNNHNHNNQQMLLHHHHHHHHEQDNIVETVVENMLADDTNTQQQQLQQQQQQQMQQQQLLQQQQQQQQQQQMHKRQRIGEMQLPTTVDPMATQNAQDIIHHHQHASHGHYSANGTANASQFTIINTDHISEARRKMNQLIHTQTRAQEELSNANDNLDLAKKRVDRAKQCIEYTNDAVKRGTEELTDALLQEPTHWNAMYRKLVEFKDKHGHVDVKRNPLKSEKDTNPEAAKLGSWVGRVRLEARRPMGHPDHIEPYKVISLDRLGFDWDPRENYWQKKFDELKEFIQGNPEQKMPTRKTPLGVWCDGQVLEFNKFHAKIKPCYITQERIDQLNSIGFIWDRMGSAWNKSYDTLKQYYNEVGHCHVPVNYGDKTLFRWIAKQRKKYKNYKEGKKPALAEDQVKLLEEIDFFEPAETRLAKYNAQKEKERRLGKRGKHSRRGRPKSKSLIPQEAQEAMGSAQHAMSIPPIMYASPHGMACAPQYSLIPFGAAPTMDSANLKYIQEQSSSIAQVVDKIQKQEVVDKIQKQEVVDKIQKQATADADATIATNTATFTATPVKNDDSDPNTAEVEHTLI